MRRTMRIKPTFNKATIRVFALAITVVMCTLVILSAIAPFPEASQWNFLSIGTSQRAAYAQGSGNWTINGSTVYWEDDKAYLLATPHTLNSSGWVEFELESKVWSGEIDVVWGFPSDITIKPKNPQRWALNVSHELQRQIIVEKLYTLNVCNISTWTKLTWNGIEPDIGNHNNTNIYNVTAADWQCTGTSGNYTSYIIAFNSYEGTKQHAIFYGNRDTTETQNYYEYYDDWVSWNPPPMQMVNYTYAGVDQWHIVKLDQAIQAGKRYRVRAWIDIPIRLGEWNCKYVWAVKPNAETIQQAKDNGHLYLLDPWLSSSWGYRKPITVTNANADYQTKVLVGESSGATGEQVDCGGNIQTDFDDLRFTRADGTTLLDYWIESITGTTPNQLATVWVQNNAGTPDTTLYMYYGKADATAVSNGTNTFILFDDFLGTSLDLGLWAKTGTVTVGSGVASTTNNQAWTNYFRSVSTFARTASALRARAKGSDISANYFQILFSYTAAAGYIQPVSGSVFQSKPTIYYDQDGVGTFGYQGATYTANQYYLFDIKLAYPTLKFDVDNIEKFTKANWSTSYNNQYVFCGNSKGTSTFDWVLVRKYTATEPSFAFGSEETAPVAPTVTTQSATDVLSTSCIGNGNITSTGGENATTRGFCYMVGTSGDPTTANSTVYDNGAGSYGTGTYTKSITSLTPSTGYRVRAYAINSAGTGYGATVQVTTLPGDPSALTDTAHGGTSINLTWTKGTGADKTLIRYRTDQYPTGTSDGTQAYFATASATTVGSLSYGQIYYFRAWAYNTTTTLYSSGTSDRSAFTDPAAPTAFTVTEVTCNCSIALNWTKGVGADKTRVQFRNDQYPTTYTDGTQAYFNTGTSVNVTSLNCSSTYYFRAWSYDTESGYYDSYAELTQDTISEPTAITQDASNIGETIARINGKISDGGGESCEARFRWRKLGTGVEEQTVGISGGGMYSGDMIRGGQTLIISNRYITKLEFWLKKEGNPTGDITYTIRKVSDDSIIASKVLGDASSLTGDYASYEATFASPTYINQQVRLLAEYSGGNSSNFVWLQFSLANVKGSEYYVEYFAGYPYSSWGEIYDCKYRYTYEDGWVTTDWQNTLVTDSTYYKDLTGLTAGTEYEYQTQAQNCAGEGEWSASAYFTTLLVEIDNIPTTNDFGILEVNSTANTAINYFTLNNMGNCPVDVTIQGTDVSGGDDTWDLSDTATPGENIYGLYVGLDDVGDLFDIIVRETATYNTLVSDLAEGITQAWGLKLYMPTSVSGYDVQQMSGTVTLVASASS